MSRNIFGRGSDDASPEPTVGDDNDDADDDYQRLYHHHVVAETDLIAAVREVHADDAHAGLHHLLQHVHFLCCRSYTRTAVMLHNISSNTTRSIKLLLLQDSVGNHLDCKRNHSATSNSMKLIHALAIDGWAVTFGIAVGEPRGAAARPGPSSLYQM